MLRTLSLTGLSIILQSINVANKDEVGDGENDGNEINLSNLFVSKTSTRAGYLTFGGAKKFGGNTKKGVEVAKSPNYLTLVAKKAFNYLRHAFIQVVIF